MAASDSPVLILTGPPGVGKTTAATLLATQSSAAVHLEADSFFHFIRSGYIEPWLPDSREQNRLVMEIVGQAAASYAGGGYLTIVDGIVIPRWSLGRLRDTLGAAGHKVAYVVLRAPVEECAKRVSKREGVALGDAEGIGRVWAEFADLGEFEHCALDVSGRTPEEVAAAVAQALAGGEHTV